jgi:hypothetical protein
MHITATPPPTQHQAHSTHLFYQNPLYSTTRLCAFELSTSSSFLYQSPPWSINQR